MVENTSIMTANTGSLFSSAFAGRRVLITGGLGFIGSTLALRLAELGSEVAIFDLSLPESGANQFNIASIKERVVLEIGDIRDTPRLELLVRGADFVFNLAGQTSHLGSMEDPLNDLDTNCRAQVGLLEAVRKHAPDASVVYACTRQIYGKPERLPIDESYAPQPPDANGISKMAGEGYHLMYSRAYGLKTCSLRLTNTYGPRMRIRDAHQGFLGIWLRRVLEGEPFEVWGGTQLRDFSYVDDTVEALLRAAIGPGTKGLAFNIGAGGALSLLRLAELLVAAHGGGRFEIRSFPPERQRIDIGDYEADDRLFRRVTGWTPKTSLVDGLAMTLAYYRQNLARYI
jgi:UDP-glucose 4-epimerase